MQWCKQKDEKNIQYTQIDTQRDLISKWKIKYIFEFKYLIKSGKKKPPARKEMNTKRKRNEQNEWDFAIAAISNAAQLLLLRVLSTVFAMVSVCVLPLDITAVCTMAWVAVILNWLTLSASVNGAGWR